MVQEKSPDLQYFLDQISSYEREFKKWESRVEKIVRKYADTGGRQKREGYSEAVFNILWSNVQTLMAATFSKLPKPDVSRRFKDNDPVGRVASLILERALDYEIQKYSDYGSTLEKVIFDRFVGGRGQAWIRYEPHFRAGDQPIDGDEITEDIDEPNEQLDYECAPVDYVHWKDFGHSIGRSWEEVQTVWRKVYLTREQCVERFGDAGKKIPLDSKPDDERNRQSEDKTKDRALVYEIWHKPTKTALWISKSVKQILDEKDDPLCLEDFFPCPCPLYASVTTDSLIPCPDYAIYQDQAEELNIISDRIDGLVKGLKIAGCYDASNKELGRVFQEGTNNSLLPVTNWAAFAEKGGVTGAIQLVDLTPLANALKEQYTAFEQVKSQIYELTGISDIIRGQTVASETATAQQIKGQYASLRLKSYQDEVSRFASELLKMKAQVICGKFAPQTIRQISAANQLDQKDQQVIPQALELLVGQERIANPDADPGPNPIRNFRIDIESDTLVYLDEQQEKQSRVEFVTAIGNFADNFAKIAPIAPDMVPLLMDLLKFTAQAFKVGKSIEGKIDQIADQVTQKLIQQQQQPNVDAQLQNQKTQLEGQKVQGQIGLEQQKQGTEQIKAQAEGVRAQADVIQSHNDLQAAQFQAMHPNVVPLGMHP